LPSVGERPARRLARQTLAEIVEPRYEELFGLVREELRRSGFEEVIAAASCSPAAAPRWKARSSRRGSVPRAGALRHPQAVRRLSDVVAQTRFIPPAGLLLYARDNVRPAHRGHSLGGNAKSVFVRNALLVQATLKLTERMSDYQPNRLYPVRSDSHV